MAPGNSFWDGGTAGPAKVGGISLITGGKARQGLHDASSTQNYPLGYRLAFEDGRVFRYAHFKSACSQGKLSAADTTSQVVKTMNACFKTAAAAAWDAIPAGTETLYLKNSNITTAHSDDCLAGGFMHVTDESSEGYTYKIRSTDFTVATSLLRVDLYDPIKEVIDSEDSAAITGCRFKNVAIYNALTDDILAGVTMADMTATLCYGWVQTWGEGTCLLDGTATLGGIVTGSDGVDGAIQPMGGGVKNSEEQVTELIPEPVVGYFMQVVPTTEYCPIYLMLAP